jgi:hypothetical protein
MATRTLSTPPDNNTDANFRAWINEINNALIAFGWTATSDTGQINFSTVTRPTATSTIAGYAMYQMGDSLQSTTAVFMKLEFGTGTTTDCPRMDVTIGIGATDGAGTIIGIQGSWKVITKQTLTGSATSTTSFNCRSSGSSSSFRCHFWSTSISNVGFTLIVERDKDTSGADTANGVNILMFAAAGTNIWNSQHLNANGFLGNLDTTRFYAMITSSSSQSGGGNIGIGPVRVPFGPMRNPFLGILIYARTDFTIETTTSVTIYGSSHTYLCLRPNLAAAVALNQWNTDCGLAMLWE